MAGIYNPSAKGTATSDLSSAEKFGKINNATLPNLQPFIQAGINPKTGLPIKMSGGCSETFKTDNKKLLRIMDEQDAINSIEWEGLPDELDGNLIERILYYRGQGMFFYMDADEKYYFLPYALDGTIDVYGRYVSVTPLPFNGTANDGDKVKPWITGLTRECQYSLKDEITDNSKSEKCVLLHDYSQQMSQTNISRQVLNDPLLDIEADMLPFARTALLNSTGVLGMRVNSQDEYSNVEAASRSINRAALEGKKYIPVVGNVDFQEMAGGDVAKAEEFLMTMQSIDNYRLSLHGLDSGGIFQKKSHMLESENEMNEGKSSFTMQDRLYQREKFCELINKVFGLNVSVKVAESALPDDQADFSSETPEDKQLGGFDNE